MMVDKYLRETKEQVLTPIALRGFRAIHPIAITLAAFAFGVVAVGLIYQKLYLAGLALFLLNRVLDGLDGTVARLTGRQSDFGAYLDIVLDIFIYAAVPAAIALSINTIPGYVSLIALLSSFYLNAASWMYLSALLEKRQAGAAAHGEKTSVTMPSGLLEGSETIAFFVLFLLFPTALVPLFVVMALLTLFTTLQRVAWAARAL